MRVHIVFDHARQPSALALEAVASRVIHEFGATDVDLESLRHLGVLPCDLPVESVESVRAIAEVSCVQVDEPVALPPTARDSTRRRQR